MTIEELEDNHHKSDSYYYWGGGASHVNLSIQFTIEVLEEIFTDGCGKLDDVCTKSNLVRDYTDKIQELKQYLDEKV